MKTKTREKGEIEKECNNYTLIDDRFRFYLLSTFKIIIDRYLKLKASNEYKQKLKIGKKLK